MGPRDIRETHLAWFMTGSTLSPIILTWRLSNSGLIGHAAEFSRAHRRKILRVPRGAEHSDPVVEPDPTFWSAFKIRRYVANLQSHDRLPLVALLPRGPDVHFYSCRDHMEISGCSLWTVCSGLPFMTRGEAKLPGTGQAEYNRSRRDPLRHAC